jgi:UDP-glucuronate 4-epimerase
MRVLVTGAAGFVGARLCEMLLEGGYHVAGFDIIDGLDPPGWQEGRIEEARANERFSFTRGDVTDAAALDQAMAAFRPEAVVHLASRRDLEWAELEPEACMRLHLEGCSTLLLACRRNNVKQAVIGSSSHVYGGSHVYPFSESDAADRPLSVFGAAQRAAELFAHAFSLRSPISITLARIFSVYGPRQSPERLVPALAEAAERRVPMGLRGDGTAGRDMIHVDDLVVGILRILDRPVPWRVLNLGTGQTTTLAQVAEQLAWLADIEFQRKSLALRPGEMPNTFADIHQAEESIGFQPRLGLEEGLRLYWEWHTQRPLPFRRRPEPRKT